MDNFTHSLTGWALGQTGLKTKTRKGLAALIVSANLPDIDVLLSWVPWQPLATHRGFTHGLFAGTIILPALLAALLWTLDRGQCSRGAVFRSGLAMDVRWLILLSYLGGLTHPLLDLQTTYAVQLLSPFSTRWFHTETLFIVDAVIWTVLSFAIWLSRRRERQNLPWRRPAIVGLAAACLYLGLNGAISLAARQALTTHLGQPPEIAYARQEPILFWKRSLVWRQQGHIGQASYDPFHSLDRLFRFRPLIADQMHDPLVPRAIRAAPGLQSFLRWSTMPVALIQRNACKASIEFADARFMIPEADGGPLGRARPFGQPPVILPLTGDDCPTPR